MFFKIKSTSGLCFLLASFILSTSGEEIDKLKAELPFKTPLGRELLKRSKVAEIKSWMNTTENPCNDFYNFACGNWQKYNSAEVQKKDFTNKFQIINTAMERRIVKFLTRDNNKNVTEIQKIQDFYKSCEDTDYSREMLLPQLEGVIKEFGEFSFLKIEDDNETLPVFNWWTTVAKIYNKYGLSFIIKVNVDNHLKDTTSAMLYMEQSDSLLHPAVEDIVLDFFTDFLDATDNEARFAVNNLYNFQKALSNAGSDARSGKSPEEKYILYNLTSLQEQYNALFDIKEFLKILLSSNVLPTHVYVSDAQYFENLIDIFYDIDPNTVEDYILWLLVEEYLTGLLSCSYTCNRYFGKYLQHTIYQEFRSLEYENEISRLWYELKDTFRYGLQTDRYPWISNITRYKAVQKLNATKFQFNTYDEDYESFFKDLQIDPEQYVTNVQNILRHIESKRGDKLLITPPGINDIQRESFTSGYDDRRNLIKFPISSLQPFHMWHSAYPQALKYASWGTVMAHEMLHAFDDYGRHFDGSGTARRWWDRQSIKEFEKRRKCFQAQYSKYSFEGHSFPDSVNQRVNIADNGAVKIAYLAYNRWLVKERKMRKNVDETDAFTNFPYNNTQLFFIGYAQFWCEDIHQKYHSYYITEDIHGPSKFRVIGSLSNFPKFAEAFKCNATPNARMNPPRKCDLF